MTNPEVWKPVVGFEGRYEVSNLGRVKSLPRFRSPKENILKASINKSSHWPVINLTTGVKGDRGKTFNVHTIMVQAFYGEPDSIEFINGDRTDVRLANLKLDWGLHKAV